MAVKIKNLFMVLHTHRHGITTYNFRSFEPVEILENLEAPGLQLIADLLKIDFEPDKEEFLEVVKMDLQPELLDLSALVPVKPKKESEWP